jgi:hypothetical protein
VVRDLICSLPWLREPELAVREKALSSGPKANSPGIDEIAPIEKIGRETAARYKAQFRAAAYACLQILSGKGIDRVYCDYQDDFVCRERVDGSRIYHFYQVKTKGKLNHLWSKSEVLGIPKRGKAKAEKLAESFAGKLMLHTVRFKSACGNVVFLTNVYLDDELSEVAESLTAGDLSPKSLQTYVEKFNEAFECSPELDSDTINKNVAKLRLDSGNSHLNPHSEQFDSLARDAIYKYSEVDLRHTETEELIQNLVSLVEKKSSAKLIRELSEEELDEIVGIGITDLLDILSISKGAYELLLAGGDPTAVKSASIIQRKLSKAGATEQIVEFCSKWKVEWDVWLREKRHTIPEYDMNSLLDRLNTVQNQWSSGNLKFADLRTAIDAMWSEMKDTDVVRTLSKELLVGGVFSALVKSEAQ